MRFPRIIIVPALALATAAAAGLAACSADPDSAPASTSPTAADLVVTPLEARAEALGISTAYPRGLGVTIDLTDNRPRAVVGALRGQDTGPTYTTGGITTDPAYRIQCAPGYHIAEDHRPVLAEIFGPTWDPEAEAVVLPDPWADGPLAAALVDQLPCVPVAA
ncbi:hypothetical protein [Candidatus Corynebacterium faecigallinarum]|uniref:hypothetical protein n=1 Tax=Candidatus Corynebacterium faecigallinarum TaxID=2838528 RepID=UPI003FD42373